MKTASVVALLFFSSWTAFPQGQVILNNRISGVVVAPIFGPDPANPELAQHGNQANGTPSGTQHYSGPLLQGFGYTAQLFGGPTNAVPADLQALAPATVFRLGEGAGFLEPPDFPVTVPGVPEGMRAKLQLRVWDNDNATVNTWEEAQAREGIVRGESLPFLSRPLGQSVILPPNLDGLESFNLALPAGVAGLLPSRPTGLEATPVSSTQIRVSWQDNSTNELGFQIERSLDGLSFVPDGTATSNVTSSASLPLQPGLRYHYRVRAFNAAGESAFSNTNFTSTRTPFAQWQLTHFTASQLSDPAIAGREADPDHDGIKNFAEYTFALPPLSADLQRPGTAGVERLSNQLDYLTLEYSRNKEALDASVQAEISSTLFNWQFSSNLLTGPIRQSESETVITEKFRDNSPIGTFAQRFLRLTVTDMGLRNSWETNVSMPGNLAEVASGLISRRLYIVGGGSSALFAFDIAANRWTNLNAARPFPGHHHAAEVFKEKLYLLGGLGGGSEGTVQIYDPSSNSWSVGASLPFAAGSSASALIHGQIYVAGGIASGTTTNRLARYDPMANTWTNLASMPQGRNSTASGTDGELFYVFGGRSGGDVLANGTDTLQIYNPTNNTWISSASPTSLLVSLPQFRSGMGKAVFCNGEFFVMGGETLNGPGATPQRVYNRVDIYNRTSNQWRQGTPMLTARHGIFPVLEGERIFVAGGGLVADFNSSALLEVYHVP